MKRKRDYPRIGMGYDVHKLEKGRKLLLGGVDIAVIDRKSVV